MMMVWRGKGKRQAAKNACGLIARTTAHVESAPDRFGTGIAVGPHRRGQRRGPSVGLAHSRPRARDQDQAGEVKSPLNNRGSSFICHRLTASPSTTAPKSLPTSTPSLSLLLVVLVLLLLLLAPLPLFTTRPHQHHLPMPIPRRPFTPNRLIPHPTPRCPSRIKLPTLLPPSAEQPPMLPHNDIRRRITRRR